MKVEDGGGGLLDRAPADVDHRPIVAAEGLARGGHFQLDRLQVDVVGLAVLSQRQQPVAADLHQLLRAGGEGNDEWAVELLELGRQRHAGYEGHVGRLDATVRKVDAGGRLRGPGHAHHHDVGVLELIAKLAIVVGHGVVHRLDAAEVLGVHDVLATRKLLHLGPQIIAEGADHRVQNRDAGNLQPPASRLQHGSQVTADEGIEYQTRVVLDPLHHPVHIALGVHQRPHVLDRVRVLELDDGGLGHGHQGLAGGIGDHVKVKLGH